MQAKRRQRPGVVNEGVMVRTEAGKIALSRISSANGMPQAYVNKGQAIKMDLALAGLTQ